MEWVIGLIAAVTGLIGVPAAFFTAKMTASAQTKNTEVETRAPEWQAFLTEVRAENQKTKDELNGKIDRLNSKVQSLEDGLKRVTGKYQASLNYILQWRRKYPRDPLIDVLPAEVREDLPSYWPRDAPEV